MEGEVMRGIKNPNVDIKTDGNDIIVTDGKTEYFRKPKRIRQLLLHMIFILQKSIWIWRNDHEKIFICGGKPFPKRH